MIHLDFERRTTSYDGGSPLHLRRREFDVLAFLYLNFGKVCSREEILASAYQKVRVKPDTRAVDNVIKRLRKRLPAGAIRSERGVGYVLELQPEDPPQTATYPRRPPARIKAHG